MTPRAAARLGARALNRASLARQFLLGRDDTPALDAVAHLGGLQAQEPQEPFVGLWSRLSGFDPALLSTALTDRSVVRTHLMRHTVHLVTAGDALAWRARHEAMLRQRMLGVYRRAVDGVDLDAVARAAATLLADGVPRSAPEIARALGECWPDVPTRALADMLPSLLPLVQLPPRGVWRATGGVRYVPMPAWLGREPEGDDDGAAGRALVRRYLAAFGPAASADLRAWCGLAGLPAAVAAVREELVTFRDERGRELHDLPDAPRPDPDTPAPVRFLPAFDNAILGYDDRSRIVDDAHKGLSVNGQRAVLVDGRVAATWTSGPDGSVAVDPLRRFSRSDRTAVAEEGRAVAAFLSGGVTTRVRVAASPR